MKRLLTKLLLLILLIAAAQVAIGPKRFVMHMEEPQVEMEKILSQQASVIVFGDSVEYTIAPSDKEGKTLDQTLQLKLPDRKVSAFAHPGFDLQVFAAMAGYLSRSAHPPDVVVVELNLRSFCPEWVRRPALQFVRERAELDYGDNRLAASFLYPLMVFRGIEVEPITPKEYYRTPISDGERSLGALGNFYVDIKVAQLQDEKAVRDMLRLRYLIPIDASHPRLKSLADGLDRLASRGIHAVTYVTPVDFDTGRRYTGDRFEEVVSKKADLVAEVAAAHGGAPLRLEHALAAKDFIWREELNYPTEHLYQTGKDFVASRVADAIRALPPPASTPRDLARVR